MSNLYMMLGVALFSDCLFFSFNFFIIRKYFIGANQTIVNRFVDYLDKLDKKNEGLYQELIELKTKSS